MSIPSIEPERIPQLKREFLLRIMAWYRPYGLRILAATLFILLGVGFTVAQPLILRNLVDQATRGSDFTQLALAAALLVLLPVLSAALGVIQQRLTGLVSANVQFDLRNTVYEHLQHLPYRMFVHAPPGEITARLSGDIQQTNQIIIQTFPDGTTNLLRLIGTLAAMFVLEWRLTLAALLVLPLLGWFSRKRNYTARKLALNSMQANTAIGIQIGETTNAGGVMSARLFNRVRHEINGFRALSVQLRSMEIAQNNLLANNIIWGSTIAALGTAAVYAAGGLLVFGGGFTIGTVIAFVAYLGGLYAALQSLLRLPQSLALSLTAYQRIFELLNLEIEAPGPTRNDLPTRAYGELTFEQVTFRFNDAVPLRETARPWSMRLMGQSAQATTTEQQNALENISFAVHPGCMVAIVGPSGAGKSTIFNLVPRFYDPDQGQIRLDGQDLRELPVEWLRQQVGLVSQGIYIAPGTLGDNLRYANPNATDEELFSALKAANLEDWVFSLPHGLETFLGQAGARLSGGERQRLAIARAILKDAPLLLLDEATSHLDSINESLLQDALFRVRQERTTLVIAHRLSTVHDADEILVLDHGKIIERGVHQQLLAQNGLYARLYEKQFVREDKD